MREYEKFESEVDQKLSVAKRKATERISRAQTALEAALKAPSQTIEMEEKKMIEAEIDTAKDTINKLAKAKNELYSINVIFGKYRDIVALTSFYEYLLSGRSDY